MSLSSSRLSLSKCCALISRHIAQHPVGCLASGRLRPVMAVQRSRFTAIYINCLGDCKSTDQTYAQLTGTFLCSKNIAKTFDDRVPAPKMQKRRNEYFI